MDLSLSAIPLATRPSHTEWIVVSSWSMFPGTSRFSVTCSPRNRSVGSVRPGAQTGVFDLIFSGACSEHCSGHPEGRLALTKHVRPWPGDRLEGVGLWRKPRRRAWKNAGFGCWRLQARGSFVPRMDRMTTGRPVSYIRGRPMRLARPLSRVQFPTRSSLPFQRLGPPLTTQ